MKYLVSLVLGMTIGATLFFLLLYFNPFAGKSSVSPLAVTEENLIDISYSAVPGETIVFTNDGESLIKPYPAKVQQLWEPAIKESWVSVIALTDPRGEPLGIGVKFSSESESTRVLNAEALVHSAWHIYLPGRGTLFVDQTENFWSFLRDIVIPAHWSSGDNWRGSWHRNMTVGPGALGTARVTGGSGAFSALHSEAVESLTARAYSAVDGPVAMGGNLTISIPAETARID